MELLVLAAGQLTEFRAAPLVAAWDAAVTAADGTTAADVTILMMSPVVVVVVVVVAVSVVAVAVVAPVAAFWCGQAQLVFCIEGQLVTP